MTLCFCEGGQNLHSYHVLLVVFICPQGVPLSTKLCPDDVNCNKIVAGITVTTTAPMTTTITTFPTTERGKTESPTPAAVVAKGFKASNFPFNFLLVYAVTGQKFSKYKWIHT